jgi:hypothetical protein
MAFLITAFKQRTKINIGVLFGAILYFIGGLVTKLSEQQKEIIGADGIPTGGHSYSVLLYGYYITILGLGIIAICLLIKAIYTKKEFN